MRFLLCVLLALAISSCLVAQQTETDLRARLVRAPLYLRGQWGTDKLAFDETGKIKGTSHAVSFTLSGIDVQSVKLTGKKLELQGQRVGLEFEKDAPQRVGLLVRSTFGGSDPEKMEIVIDRPADGDFKAALDVIFAGDVASLVPQLPAYWQTFAQKHLLSAGSPAAALSLDGGTSGRQSVAPPDGTVKLPKVGGSVKAPVLQSMVNPEFDDSARALKYSGIVLVNLVVDPAGTPRLVHILRPTGLGLDERAIAAVEKYTFKPAMRDGTPVAVELNVEVNFQVF